MFSFCFLDKLHILLGRQWNNWIGPWGTWLLFDGYYFFFVRTGSLSHSLCGEHGLIKKLLFIMSYVNIYIFFFLQSAYNPQMSNAPMSSYIRPQDRSHVPTPRWQLCATSSPKSVDLRCSSWGPGGSSIGFVKTLQKPWGKVGIFDLLLQSRPPLQKKNQGGLPFTIVDVTLHQKINNPWFSLIRAWH